VSILITFKLTIILFCRRNTSQILHVVDEAYFKLEEWSHILLSPLSRAEKPETLSSLKLSIDDAVYIIQRLYETFTISNYE